MAFGHSRPMAPRTVGATSAGYRYADAGESIRPQSWCARGRSSGARCRCVVQARVRLPPDGKTGEDVPCRILGGSVHAGFACQ